MRRKYSKQEKLAAIQRYESGEPLDLNPDLVRRWRDEWHKYGSHAFSGYGNRRTQTPQKTEPVVFRLKNAEYERLAACIRSSEARTLSEFVRGQVFQKQPETDEIERQIERLSLVVNRLTRIVAKA